ncbi:MAG: hypothetical protein SFX73_28550 [Kofleriaceae bacterium]|nr:hypothetical protein [Kofleriaceae bacterium]
MRNLSLSVVMLVAIAACGPSNKEVAMAKQARYQGDKIVLFNAAKAAVEAKHKLEKSDELALGMQTIGRWYTRDGMVSRGTDQNIQDIPDQAIRLTLVVRLVPDGDNYLVTVEPAMLRRNAGSPQPQPLKAGDVSVPGWVPGQVDELQFAIYDALKPYEVKAGGAAVVPAASPAAPAADPVTPPPATDPAVPSPAPAP